MRESILEMVQAYGDMRVKELLAGATYIPPTSELEVKYTSSFYKKLLDIHKNSMRSVKLTNSGSSANLLAISAITSPILGDKQLRKGDEVITVAAGFPTT